MRPYYEEDGITIYNADCREILIRPIGDLILTDPPYGIGESYLQFSDTKENLTTLLLDVVPRMLEYEVAMITCGNGNQSLYPEPSWTLAFATPAGVGMCTWGFSCWQPILVYGRCPYLKRGLGARPDLFIHTESSEKNGHPCPKPINLWKKILTRGSASELDVVVDPFMGSGTTLLAAKQLGRKAIGIEISEKYCEIAVKRLAQIQLDFSKD